ncbi:MAG: T9SS type A sorting domain-containing protein, partial [Bacteroidota bacterium]
IQHVGPKLDSLQTTPWVNNGVFPVLRFEVIEPTILESFAIYQDSGQGVIAFITPLDNQLGFRAGFSDSLGPGYQEIDVNWYLPKGRYEFRGGTSGMHVLEQNLQFPYEINGLISIESSTQNNYPFFFDWKVREASCWSERVPVNIRSGLAVQPVADFGYIRRNSMFLFNNLGKAADRYRWDFGDGQYSEEASPTHFYQEIGPYEVGLQVWFAGCSDFIQTSIQVETIANALQVYPNPASDLLTVEFAGLETQTYRIEIFDLAGKRLYVEELGEIEAGVVGQRNLEVRDWARGVYVVRLRSPQQSISQKLLID